MDKVQTWRAELGAAASTKEKCWRGRDRRNPRVLWSACQDGEPQVQGNTLNREGCLPPDNLGSSIGSTQWKERIYS